MVKNISTPTDDEDVVFLNKRLQNDDEQQTVIKLPSAFQELHSIQQNDAIKRMEMLSPRIQQALLDDWARRIEKGTLYSKAGYLFKLIALAIKGEYVPIYHEKKNVPLPVVAYRYAEAQEISPAINGQEPEMVKNAAMIARQLLEREKTYQAQRNLEVKTKVA